MKHWKEKAEISVETTIVVTVILLLIGGMIYFTLYIHDVVAIKSFAISGLVESASQESEKAINNITAKINKTPRFVLRTSSSFEENSNSATVTVVEKGASQMKLINNLIELSNDTQKITVIKKMSISKMHLYKAIKDGFAKENGS